MRATAVLRGRRHDLRFLRGVAATLVLTGAFLVTVFPLRPELEFGPC